MFGKGVYFADMASKSAQYCCATADKPDGLLLLCEVALGRSRELAAAEYLESAGRGHHSVKGCGRTMPDPSQARTRPRGCGPGQGRGHERRRFGRPRSRRLLMSPARALSPALATAGGVHGGRRPGSGRPAGAQPGGRRFLRAALQRVHRLRPGADRGALHAARGVHLQRRAPVGRGGGPQLRGPQRRTRPSRRRQQASRIKTTIKNKRRGRV